jgi:heat shock protein HslJ
VQRNLVITTVLMLFALGLSACVKQQEPVVNETAPADTTHHASLLDTYWKLLELQGEPVVTPGSMREAHLILASSESRAHGFSGCNNFFGGYESAGDSLSFSAMGATMMACVEGMETEQAFLKALSETTRATINGQFMELYADDLLLARFEAIYL